MALHPRDKANAYAVGMLEQVIKIAVYDLERGQALVALARLKATLATWEQQAKYHVEHTDGAGVPLPTI